MPWSCSRSFDTASRSGSASVSPPGSCLSSSGGPAAPMVCRQSTSRRSCCTQPCGNLHPPPVCPSARSAMSSFEPPRGGPMTSLAATPTQRPNGPVVGNTDGPTTYYDLMGGTGTVKLKRLLSGPQMASSLEIAERVEFLEGASCGLHQHTRTEEVYYLLDGHGEMEMNGERLEVHSGDLVITPLGSTHRIGGFGNTNVAILVVEMLPGPASRCQSCWPTGRPVRPPVSASPALNWPGTSRARGAPSS